MAFLTHLGAVILDPGWIQDGGPQENWEEEDAAKEGCHDHSKFGNHYHNSVVISIMAMLSTYKVHC